MTKEEYEKLLQSDYWKGYSYSLIKERDFTCEDCGRRFYNERNKLQVHHLVYRDVSPWSYKPEEVRVLCEECHKKRHGIPTEPSFSQSTTQTQNPQGKYTKSYTTSESNKHNINLFWANLWNSKNVRDKGYNKELFNNNFPKNYTKPLFVILGLVLLWALSFGLNKANDPEPLKDKEFANERVTHPTKQDLSKRQTQQIMDVSDISKKDIRGNGERINQVDNQNTVVDKTIQLEEQQPIIEATQTIGHPMMDHTISANQAENQDLESHEEYANIEKLGRDNHADMVKRAQRAGVSTEGSTLEILERINHADMVKRAQRAGVSTEGSTLEILERINHADMVKRAQRAGVSTEGSTLEILERINHADMVKRAQRAGVSTEGSTLEILERINHADMVKRAQRAGVSTEGKD